MTDQERHLIKAMAACLRAVLCHEDLDPLHRQLAEDCIREVEERRLI
jgi:hypothetical protein